MTRNRACVVVWTLLVVLTLASFAGEASGALRAGPALLLGIALAKTVLVGGWYMDLRRAHVAWRLGWAAVAVASLGALWLLQAAAPRMESAGP